MGADNFNRASLGANWTTPTGADAMSIVGSTELQCSNTGDPSLSYYNPETPGADQWCEWTISTTTIETAIDAGSGGALRVSTSASTSYFGITNTNASGEVQTGKVVADTVTMLSKYTAGAAPGNNVVMRLEVQGTGASCAIRMYVGGVLRVTHNGDTSLSSGRYGSYGIANAVRSVIDDWSAGNLATGKAPLLKPLRPIIFRSRRYI